MDACLYIIPGHLRRLPKKWKALEINIIINGWLVMTRIVLYSIYGTYQ